MGQLPDDTPSAEVSNSCGAALTIEIQAVVRRIEVHCALLGDLRCDPAVRGPTHKVVIGVGCCGDRAEGQSADQRGEECGEQHGWKRV